MTDEELQERIASVLTVMVDKYPDEGVRVSVEFLRALIDKLSEVTAESDALKAQQENQHADAYTAGYDAGEEAASRDISSLRAQLANMTAERDELAAVPVAAIRYHWLNSRMDVFEIDIHSEEYRKYCAAEDTIEAWLPKQVQP